MQKEKQRQYCELALLLESKLNRVLWRIREDERIPEDARNELDTLIIRSGGLEDAVETLLSWVWRDTTKEAQEQAHRNTNLW